MIERISDIITHGADLLEAEGRLAAAHLTRLGVVFLILAGAAALAVTAILTIGTGAILLLSTVLGLGWAMILVATLVLAASGLTWFIILRRLLADTREQVDVGMDQPDGRERAMNGTPAASSGGYAPWR